MSICDWNREILDDFAMGLGSLEEFDHQHARECPACRKAGADARSLRSLLQAYQEDADRQAEASLSGTRTPIVRPARRGLSRVFRWGAAAAALVLVFLIGRWFPAQPPQDAPPLLQDYLETLGSEAARREILDYVGRTQLFLLALLEDGTECTNADQAEAKRMIAARLIFQKKLLEPRLNAPEFSDLKPLLDDMEFLILNVADGEGCFKKEEVELWNKVIESKSALMKLRLLQERDRI